MKSDAIQTFMNRFSARQRETMIRLKQIWIDLQVMWFRNLWIVSLEVRDFWWYDSHINESIQCVKTWNM